MIDQTVLTAFVAARREERKLKAAVISWFEEQALAGMLVNASQAPMWNDYAAARDRYHHAFAQVDEAIERLA